MSIIAFPKKISITYYVSRIILIKEKLLQFFFVFEREKNYRSKLSIIFNDKAHHITILQNTFLEEV